MWNEESFILLNLSPFTSTLNSVYVINQLFLQSIIDCQKEDILVDIFQAGNIENNSKNNEKLLLKYKNNIKGF